MSGRGGNSQARFNGYRASRRGLRVTPPVARGPFHWLHNAPTTYYSAASWDVSLRRMASYTASQ
jgi:hypothetical protein